MNAFANRTEPNGFSQTACLTIAAGLHLALLVWNPAIFQETWRSMTGLADGSVVIVEVPGPQTSALPGTSGPAIKPLPQAPFRQTPLPGALPAPVGSNHSIPMDSRRALSAAVTPSPLISRSFHSMKTPELPFTTDPELVAGRTALPIGIEKGHSPARPSSNIPALMQDRARVSPINPFVPEGSLSGEGGTGRALIRFTGPAAAPSERLKSPDKHSNAQAAKGPSIEGPLSNRTVSCRVIPDYPAWAEEQGIMGAVRIYFMVTQEGLVRSTVRVERTSGYPELDRLAIDALRQWRFSPIASDNNQQWGVITFTFSLGQQ